MDTNELNNKTKQLCEQGICISMAEARRRVMFENKKEKPKPKDPE